MYPVFPEKIIIPGSGPVRGDVIFSCVINGDIHSRADSQSIKQRTTYNFCTSQLVFECLAKRRGH